MTHEPDPYLLVEAAMPADWRADFVRNAVAGWPRLQGAKPADILGILDDQDYDCGAIEDLMDKYADAFAPYRGGDVRIALLVSRIACIDARDCVYKLARKTQLPDAPATPRD